MDGTSRGNVTASMWYSVPASELSSSSAYGSVSGYLRAVNGQDEERAVLNSSVSWSSPSSSWRSSGDIDVRALVRTSASGDHDWLMQLSYTDNGYLASMSDRAVDGAICNGVLGKGRYGGGSWDEW